MSLVSVVSAPSQAPNCQQSSSEMTQPWNGSEATTWRWKTFFDDTTFIISPAAWCHHRCSVLECLLSSRTCCMCSLYSSKLKAAEWKLCIQLCKSSLRYNTYCSLSSNMTTPIPAKITDSNPCCCSEHKLGSSLLSEFEANNFPLFGSSSGFHTNKSRSSVPLSSRPPLSTLISSVWIIEPAEQHRIWKLP